MHHNLVKAGAEQRGDERSRIRSDRSGRTCPRCWL